jgi:hypothetical protein
MPVAMSRAPEKSPGFSDLGNARGADLFCCRLRNEIRWTIMGQQGAI